MNTRSLSTVLTDSFNNSAASSWVRSGCISDRQRASLPGSGDQALTFGVSKSSANYFPFHLLNHVHILRTLSALSPNS
jgi:hypothetical protein